MTQILTRPRRAPGMLSAHRNFLRLYVTVMVIQGLHVLEHTIQLLQVSVFHVPSERAFGLLGYVINFNRTAEYLHFGFNTVYLLALYVLVVALHELVEQGRVTIRAFRWFLVLGAGLETWHMTEHAVIIYHVIRNAGCPCPGIGDRVLPVTDIQLHFVYNAIVYSASLVPFLQVVRCRRPGACAG